MATRKTKTKNEPKTEAKVNRMRTTHIPLGSWIMFWALVLCTMALVVVNLGNAFAPPYPSNDDDMQTIAELQALRANLEKQVEDLQVQQMQSPDATSIASSCEPVSSPGPADSHVLYVDPTTHVSMSLPYSTSWGNGCAATRMDNEGIHFGPNLESSIAILDPNSVPAFDVKLDRTVSGLKVYMPSNMITFAIGKTYAYRIQTKGWLTDAEINKLIQSLKVTQ
jgi:hypothetical protein